MDLLRNVVKNALMARIMQNQQPGRGQGANQPGAPQPNVSGQTQAPMPSTPLPGA